MTGIKFIIGEIGSGKSYALIERIRAAAEKNKRTMLIVPEQFSSAAEHKLYNALGIQLFNKIQVETFSRIRKAVRRQSSCGGTVPDDAAKTAVMYTVRRDLAESELKCFGSQMKNPAFTSACIKMARELEMNGIAPEKLRSGNIEDSALAAKTDDISRICSDYNLRLRECGYVNAVSDGAEISEAAARLDLFRDCEIFIDQFKSFTADQKMLIDIMKSQGHVTVAMPTPYPTPNDSPVFSAVNENINRLDENAETEIISGGTDRYEKAPDIRILSRSVLRDGKTTPFKAEHIHGAEAANIYEEAEYVCAEISRLVRSGKYKYSDIAVLSRDFENVRAPLEEYFLRYDIPYFADSPSCASSKPLMIFILTALEIASREKPTAEMLLRLMKTGFTPVEEAHINELEQYYTEHGITKESWENDPTGAENSDISYAELAEYDSKENKAPEDINESLEKTAENAAFRVGMIRRAVMSPLSDFRKACGKTSPLKKLCENTCTLTSQLRTAEKMGRYTEKNDISTGDPTPEAREAARVWKTLDSALKAAAAVTLPVSIDSFTLKDFREIMSIIISQISISSPAQSVNCVTASASNRARLDSPKVVFIMSAVSGMFPFRVSESSIFTEHELEILEEKLDIHFAGRIASMAAEENFIAVNSLAAPSEELYITYPLSGTSGRAYYRSGLTDTIFGMTGITPLSVSELPHEFFITTADSAYFRYVRSLGKQDEFSSEKTQAVKRIFGQDTADRMDAAGKFSRELSDGSLLKISLSTERALKLYTGKNRTLNISASRLEDFAKCPFMFFCGRGLKLKPVRKFEFAANVRGTAVHSVLCSLLKIISAEAKETGESFNSVFFQKSREWLKKTINKLMSEYSEASFKSQGFLPTPSFEKSLMKQSDAVLDIALHMQREFDPKNSRFSPAAFEYSIGKSYPDGRQDMPPKTLTAKTADGTEFTVNFTGSVDRIDIFTDSSSGTPVDYLRVVDYKTGTKVFKLEDITEGINMQMLLYLYAVTDDDNAGGNIFGGYSPAGIMYMPSRSPSVKTEKTRFRGNADERNSAAADEAFRMNGLTLNSVNVVRAMEYNADGKFINQKLNTEAYTSMINTLCSEIRQTGHLSSIPSEKKTDDMVTHWAMTLEKLMTVKEFAALHPELDSSEINTALLEKSDEKIHELAVNADIYRNFDKNISADSDGKIRRNIEELMTKKQLKTKTTYFPSPDTALSESGMDNLLSCTRDKLTSLSSEICSGCADISPLITEHPCDVCSFRSICENCIPSADSFRRRDKNGADKIKQAINADTNKKERDGK